MKLFKSFKAALVAIPLALCSMSSQAALIETALGIIIDGSGSINATDFQTQKDAYASVFNDASIVKADGSVIVNVIQFSAATQIEQTAIRLNNEIDRSTLLAAINGMTQLNSMTNIGGGIAAAVADIDNYLTSFIAADFAANFRKLLDVSTDGIHNSGTDPVTATADAHFAGYEQVNCLGIGAFADCSWNNGNPNNLDFVATTFADVERVLKIKVGTELRTVPEPSAILLMGAGLLGFTLMRKKAHKA